MPNVTGSFDKINYAVRPSKQIERRLIVETLRSFPDILSPADAWYVGMGSIYFVDFIMMHRELGIHRMICAEIKQIKARMELNKPYKFVDVRIGPVGDVPSTIVDGARHIVWLDYDSRLTRDQLRDIDGFCQALPDGSVLLVTVRADLRFCIEEGPVAADDPRLDDVLQEYQSNFGELMSLSIDDVAPLRFPETVGEIIFSQIDYSCRQRGVEFVRFFNVGYTDSAQMVTVGCVIGDHARSLSDAGVLDLAWTKDVSKPTFVSVPELTPFDRHAIDALIDMTSDVTVLPPFEIERHLVKNYLRYYRYYPHFVQAYP